MGNKRRRGEKSLELTDELIIEIISRVPEKDLVRFKCVSESWCSLINTDSYLSQLRSQRTALLDRPFLIIQKGESLSRGYLYFNYWLQLDSIEDGNPKPRLLHNPFDDDNDFPRWDAFVIGSCDGLLVLQQSSTHKMVVLNPVTKKHHVVPPNPAGDNNVDFMGFGYDHVHGCYKLVTKIKRASSDYYDELMIYNVNNCIWKKSRFDCLDNECSYPGKCVGGALYWCVGVDYDFSRIICFLLTEEEFLEVDPPDFDKAPFDAFLTVFDGDN